jgi:hypothetical protein
MIGIDVKHHRHLTLTQPNIFKHQALYILTLIALGIGNTIA